MARRYGEKRLGEALPALLEEARMSSRALARTVGVDQAHISRVMNGRLPASVELIRKIAREFDLPSDYFADYRELAALEAVRTDPALRDRVYKSLGPSERALKRRRGVR